MKAFLLFLLLKKLSIWSCTYAWSVRINPGEVDQWPKHSLKWSEVPSKCILSQNNIVHQWNQHLSCVCILDSFNTSNSTRFFAQVHPDLMQSTYFAKLAGLEGRRYVRWQFSRGGGERGSGSGRLAPAGPSQQPRGCSGARPRRGVLQHSPLR